MHVRSGRHFDLSVHSKSVDTGSIVSKESWELSHIPWCPVLWLRVYKRTFLPTSRSPFIFRNVVLTQR
eukprot:SAG22_NODE_2870_length_2138_cov_1.438450_3_plen_67_part_01